MAILLNAKNASKRTRTVTCSAGDGYDRMTIRALVVGALSALGVALFAGFVWAVLESTHDDGEGDDDHWRE